jgi:predicted RNase H-like HicB family nuclease
MQCLQDTISVVIRRGEESGYVAECMEIAVVTQGAALDEVTRNLQEAVTLHLEGENLAALGFVKNPKLVVTMESQKGLCLG